MTVKEHKEYLKAFQIFSKEILSSKEKTLEFLYEAGINTPTGRLTKAYKHQPVSVEKVK